MLPSGNGSGASGNAKAQREQQQGGSHKLAADALERQILEEDLRQRNQELVDAAWQSLE